VCCLENVTTYSPGECKGIITNRNKFPAVYAARFSCVCCISMRYRMFPATVYPLCALSCLVKCSIAVFHKTVMMISANISLCYPERFSAYFDKRPSKLRLTNGRMSVLCRGRPEEYQRLSKLSALMIKLRRKLSVLSRSI